MSPRTTVTMPAYNAEATIKEAVASALAQTVGDLELVIVDDGSRIPVSEVLEDVRDERVRIVRHDPNQGLSAARNTGLAHARAPLISQLDADDVWKPEYLESVLPCFEDPAVGLAYTDCLTMEKDGTVEPYMTSHLSHPIDRFPQIAEQNPIAALTVTARADAVRAVGGYARWLWGGQDYHLYLKLARAGWGFAYVDRPLGVYRRPEAAAMSTDYRKVTLNDLKLFAAFKLRHPLTPGPGKRVIKLSTYLVRSHTPVLSPAARALKGRLRARAPKAPGS